MSEDHPETWTYAGVERIAKAWVFDRSFPWLPRYRYVRQALYVRQLFRPIHSGHSPENYITQTRWKNITS